MSNIVLKRLTPRHTRLSNFRYFDLLVHVFVVILLISNWVVNKLQRAPGVDVYDRGTSFNPFARNREQGAAV